MVIDEVADIGIATEALGDHAELVTLPCYEWQHAVVMPPGHRLATVERISLEDLAVEAAGVVPPLRTAAARGSTPPFAARKLKPNIVLEAIDADVIKTYVRLGLGLGILARARGARRPARRRAGGTPGRPPVRAQRHAGRVQARRLPAQLRARLRRGCLSDRHEPLADRACDGSDGQDYQL
jgi:DNA-binding transcriptional LysR family regulator